MRIKNWNRFQHFKDRRPPWIKLYRDILDDHEWFSLEADAAKALISIWLIASESDGEVPKSKSLAFRLRISERQTNKILEELFDAGFIIESDGEFLIEDELTPAQQIAKKNGFGYRYITDEIKKQVFLRDKGICVSCSASDRIEFDHIQPISKGGKSTLENIQLLCRPCNRKKRAKLSGAQVCDSRSLETETETETETERERETEKRSVAKNATAQVPVVVQSNEIQTTQQKTLQAEFVEKFKKTYEQQSGQPFKMDKKHFIIAANLIKSHGLEAVEQKAAILSVMCRDQTAWFTKDGWADFTIEKLSSQWNSIIPQATMTEEDKSKQRIAELFQKEHERNERVNKIVGNSRATRS